jgi:hypothetical protein
MIDGVSYPSYCPDWCHPNTPPFSETLLSDWKLQHVSSAAGVLAASPVTVGVPADIPRDGSVAYAGSGLLPSGNQVALLGCVTPRRSGSTQSPSYAVAHLWDGHATSPMRRLPDAVQDCDKEFTWYLPLADGTWVFPANALGVSTYGAEHIVLVRP